MNAWSIGTTIFESLERSWNSHDAQAYARSFTADATFVDVRGHMHAGRESISNGHHALFATAFKGSSIRYQVVGARAIGPDVILVQTLATLTLGKTGAFKRLEATQSSVIVSTDGSRSWEIVCFHNTEQRSEQPPNQAGR